MTEKNPYGDPLAIVIAISAYAHVDCLPNARHDGEAVAQLLRDQHGYQDVRTLYDGDATLAAIRALLNELPGLLTDGRAFFLYFAGHGVVREGPEGPEGFLVPVDGTDEGEQLSMTDIHRSLHQLKSKHIMCVFDSCFAGSIFWTATRDLQAHRELYRERYVTYLENAAWQALTSAAYDERAADAPRAADPMTAKHSPFTQAFLEALEGAGDLFPPRDAENSARNAPGDGVITASELYVYVHEKLLGLGLSQTPGLRYLNEKHKGEYIFFNPRHPFDLINLNPAPAPDPKKNPYRGLAPYDEAHSSVFFGRLAESDRLTGFVIKQPLTVVLGPSGCGKSSLVHAGLVPTLKKLKLQTGGAWLPKTLRPGARPLDSLASIFGNASTTKMTWSERMAEWSKTNPSSRLLLVVDQAEELVTAALIPQDKEPFFLAIVELLQMGENGPHVVLTLRSDYEPSLGVPKALSDAWSPGRFLVSPMKASDLRLAITGPATELAVGFEPSELVDEIAEEVANAPGSLSLLSVLLQELYKRYALRWPNELSPKRVMTENDYRALGGVAGALQTVAAELVAGLKEKGLENTLRRTLLRLVSLRTGAAARRKVLGAELLDAEEPEKTRINTVLEELIAVRIVVQAAEEAELAHDALLQGFAEMAHWIREQRVWMDLREKIAEAAAEPDPKKKSYWTRSPRLNETLGYLKKDRYWLNGAERVFVEESVRKRWRERGLWVGAGVLMVGLVAVALVLRQEKLESERHSALVTAARVTLDSDPTAAIVMIREAGIRDDARDDRPVAIAGLVQPLANDQIEFDNEVIRSIVVAPSGGLTVLVAPGRGYVARAGKRLVALPQDASPLTKVILSHNEGLVAALVGSRLMTWTLSDDGAATPEKNGLDDDGISDIFFASDDDDIAVVRDKEVLVVPHNRAQALRRLPNHNVSLSQVARGPQPNSLVTLEETGAVQVWDTITNKDICRVGPEPAPQKAVSVEAPKDVAGLLLMMMLNSPAISSVSSNGEKLAFVVQGALHVYDLAKCNKLPLVPLDKNANEPPPLDIKALRFDDGGSSLIALPNGEPTAIGTQLLRWRTDDHSVFAMQPVTLPAGWRATEIDGFPSPDRLLIREQRRGALVLSLDENPRLTLMPPVEILMRRTTVTAFSKDGNAVYVGSEDGALRRFPLEPALPSANDKHGVNEVNRAAFSQTGRFLATCTDNVNETPRTSKLVVYSTADLSKSCTVAELPYACNATAVSDDGKLIATAYPAKQTDFSSARVKKGILVTQGNFQVDVLPFDINDCQTRKPTTFELGPLGVDSLAFSPDGASLAIGISDGKKSGVRRVNIKGELVWEIHTAEKRPKSLAWSDDGTMLAAGFSDRFARIYDAKNGQTFREFRGHKFIVIGVAFDRTNKRLATLDAKDGTVTLFDVQTGKSFQIRVPPERPTKMKAIGSVAFSKDGQWIAATLYDSVWLLRAESGASNFLPHSLPRAAGFMPDSSQLVTVGSNELRIWPLRAEVLSQRIRDTTIICLSPTARSELLAEDQTTAEEHYQRCLDERRLQSPANDFLRP